MARRLHADISTTMIDNSPNIPAQQGVRAPRGVEISCKGWQQEAALRMLMNSFDHDVAEARESVMPSAALAKVAADWDEFGSIADALRQLPNDATLLVQRGKSASAFPANAESARVLVVDSDAAASWLNIGPQLFVPECYEILAAANRQYFNGDLAGKLILPLGMSFAGAALSLAVMMHGAAFLGIDANSERIKRYVKTGYCDVMVNNLDEGLRILKNAVRKREPASVGLAREPAEMIQELARRGVVPDLLADDAKPGESQIAGADGVRELQKLGSILLRPAIQDAAMQETSDGATICFVALSGEPSDIRRIDRLFLELFPEDEPFGRRLRTLQRRVRYQGLPARAVWLCSQESVRLGTAVNQLVAQGELTAPIVIARLAPSFGTIHTGKQVSAKAPPESELDELLQTAGGATWASIAYDAEDHAHVTAAAVVADGTGEASARIERVLSQNIPQ